MAVPTPQLDKRGGVRAALGLTALIGFVLDTFAAVGLYCLYNPPAEPPEEVVVSVSEELLARGERLVHLCASCHASDGQLPLQAALDCVSSLTHYITMHVLRKKALIIGCGIAGPAAALFMRRAGVEPVVYEATPEPDDAAGVFLNLTPNGVHVLKTLGIEEEVRALGHASNRIVFQNSRGAKIAEFDNTDEAERYGARGILIRRGLLNRALREAAQREGIPIRFGKKLVAAEFRAGRAEASFDDGTAATGDFLIGCDGIHSKVRRTLFPAAPEPSYLDLMNTGGFARLPDLAPSPTMYMTFGRQAFFGCQVVPSGEVYWFSNFGVVEEELGAFDRMPSARRKEHLIALHAEDPPLIAEIIQATEHPLGFWPTYDLPFLERWHRGRACLIGDAAHATAPSAGQGASMALEDAVVLGKCLRDLGGVQSAFTSFEDVRKKRVERAIQQARRNSGHKVASGPVQAWIRDRILPFFLRMNARSTAWIYDYRVDWGEPVEEML